MKKRRGAVFSSVFVCAALLVCSTPAFAKDVQETETPSPSLSKLPELIEFIEAEYPPEAREAGIEASVLLELIVNESGVVEQVEILERAGKGFDEAAVKAARQFKFSPAEVEGVPVPVRITYRYAFVLKPEALPPESEETPATAPAMSFRANFKGRVLEKGSRAPVNGASVMIVNLDLETFANEKGEFEFQEVPAGELEVVVQTSGYEIFQTEETLGETDFLEVVYYIERGYDEYSVTVRAKRPQKEVVRRTLQVEEILKIPGTQGDALKVVQNLPGVARSPTISGLLVLRGADPEDTNVYLEGVRIPFLYHFGALSSVVNSQIIKSVEVYPGNYGVYYGRAIGGVIDVRTRPGKTDRWHGQLDVSLLEASALAEGPIGENGSLVIAGRRSYFDLVLKAAIPKDAPVNLLVAPRYYDFQLRFDYNFGKGHEFMIFWIGDDDRMEAAIKDPGAFSGFELSQGFQLIITRWTWRISESLTLETTPSFEYLYFNIDIGDMAGGIHARQRGYSFDLREHLTFEFSKNLLLNAGLLVYSGWDDVSVVAPRPPKEGEAPTNITSSETKKFGMKNKWISGSIYFELVYFPIERWQMVPCLRIDRYFFANDITFDPRYSTRFKIVEGTSVKGAIGLFHQSPQGDELIAEGYGNPDLGPERAVQYSLGLERQLTEFLSLDVTGFYKDMDRLVVRSDRLIERDGKTVPENYSNEGVGRAYGFELLLKHDMSKYFFGWLSYTLSRSERKDPATGLWRPFDFDQRHIFTVLGTVRLPYDFEVGARFRLVTGNPITPLRDSTFDADNFAYIPHPGETNSERLPIFHQLDIRIDKKFTFNWFVLSAYIDVQGVYYRKNPEAEAYNYDYRQKDYFRGLPIIPSFGLKLEI